jgi:hypothetical protein
LAVEMQRGHGPHRAEEVLMLAQLAVAEKTLESGKALISGQRETVFAEHEARKAAARTTGRAANTNDRPTKVEVSKGETSASFERANSGVEQERRRQPATQKTRPVETSLDQQRGRAKAAFEKARDSSDKEAEIGRPNLGLRQVEKDSAEPTLRPSPGWATEVDANQHRADMNADNRRANDRNEFLKAIADGLAERRDAKNGREQEKGAERDGADGVERDR